MKIMKYKFSWSVVCLMTLTLSYSSLGLAQPHDEGEKRERAREDLQDKAKKKKKKKFLPKSISTVKLINDCNEDSIKGSIQSGLETLQLASTGRDGKKKSCGQLDADPRKTGIAMASRSRYQLDFKIHLLNDYINAHASQHQDDFVGKAIDFIKGSSKIEGQELKRPEKAIDLQLDGPFQDYYRQLADFYDRHVFQSDKDSVAVTNDELNEMNLAAMTARKIGRIIGLLETKTSNPAFKQELGRLATVFKQSQQSLSEYLKKQSQILKTVSLQRENRNEACGNGHKKKANPLLRLVRSISGSLKTPPYSSTAITPEDDKTMLREKFKGYRESVEAAVFKNFGMFQTIIQKEGKVLRHKYPNMDADQVISQVLDREINNIISDSLNGLITTKLLSRPGISWIDAGPSSSMYRKHQKYIQEVKAVLTAMVKGKVSIKSATDFNHEVRKRVVRSVLDEKIDRIQDKVVKYVKNRSIKTVDNSFKIVSSREAVDHAIHKVQKEIMTEISQGHGEEGVSHYQAAIQDFLKSYRNSLLEHIKLAKINRASKKKTPRENLVKLTQEEIKAIKDLKNELIN